jgi:pyruvate dehydrogenase E2 component (dihydrolipoamide acetyltransferase)
MTEITMPRLSDAMEEGTILAWLKAPGDTVAEGDELVEIEIDKATMTYESPAGGELTIVAEPGATLPVGTVIATLGTTANAPAPAPVSARPSDGGTPSADGAEASSSGGPAATARSGPVTEPPPGVTIGDDTVPATPLARRIAAAHGVDLSTVHGTGPRGRVKRADVEAKAGLATDSTLAVLDPPATPAPRAAAPPPAKAPSTPASTPPAGNGALGAKGEVTIEELSKLQQVVARRMAEAKATVPEFQVQTEVQMDAALALRAQLKELGGDVVPSVNDLIVKAAALALRKWPRANASYRDGRFELYSRVNVGVAVAAQDALVVPTITDADSRSLGSIATEIRRLAERVRNGTVTPPELSGATFTVSNLGMYGMTAITPVLNMPQAAILGVGASRSVPALLDGRLIERQLMTLTLSCDHRILYGADAAQFLGAIRDLLQTPIGLTL